MCSPAGFARNGAREYQAPVGAPLNRDAVEVQVACGKRDDEQRRAWSKYGLYGPNVGIPVAANDVEESEVVVCPVETIRWEWETGDVGLDDIENANLGFG